MIQLQNVFEPLIMYIGEYSFNKRKSHEGYNQITDRMPVIVGLILTLECTCSIKIGIETDKGQACGRKGKRRFQQFCKMQPSENGINPENSCCVLQNQSFVWEKKKVSQQSKLFLKSIDTEWAQISAPAKYH